MNAAKMYGDKYPVLEIWKDKIKPGCDVAADYVVAHSLGCNWALINFQHSRNTKLILVNPLIPKRNIFIWFFQWLWFMVSGFRSKNKEITNNFGQLIFGLSQSVKLLRSDIGSMIKNLPKENIYVLRGKEDKYFCDEKCRIYLSQNNIKTIELNTNHDWSEKYVLAIDEIINKKV